MNICEQKKSFEENVRRKHTGMVDKSLEKTEAFENKSPFEGFSSFQSKPNYYLKKLTATHKKFIVHSPDIIAILLYSDAFTNEKR